MKLHLILFLFLIFSQTVFAQKHIIYIGDSHSLGNFGQTLTNYFRANKENTFEFYASGGSAPLQWTNGLFTSSCGYHDSSSFSAAPQRKCNEKFKTPKLENLIHQSRDKNLVIIIALGTNFSKKIDDRKFNIKTSQDLIKHIPEKAQCLWIGPPHMKRFNPSQMDLDYSIIEEAISLSPCELIDSRFYSEYPYIYAQTSKPDGIHYDFPAAWYKFPEGELAAHKWGENIVNYLISRGFF
jgi:hypothetical protein